MNRKKQILIAGGMGVLLVIVVVPAVLLFKGIGKFSQANQNLSRSVQELRSLYNKDPFPSRENIAQERLNVQEMEQWYSRMMSALSKEQITEEASTPTGFITHYGHVRNELVRLARQRDRQMVGADFAFGFERYADGSLPAPVDVSRLMQQLRMIEQIARVLIDSGVKQIELIRREEFESETGTGAEEPSSDPYIRRPSSRRAAARTPDQPDGLPSTEERAEPGSLFGRQHFTVQVKATESTLIDLLNRLAGHKMFVVVTGLEFKKTSSDLRMPTADAPEADAPAGETPVKQPEQQEKDIQPRQMRRVSGPELEIPMMVTLDFDVYTFKFVPGE